MADVVDIYNALGAQIEGVLYPGGTPAPGEASPVTGTVIRIYPGWPAADQLNKDIQSGIATVSMFAIPAAVQNVTRYPLDWQTQVAPVTTLTATIDATGTEITIGGAVSIPQNIGAVVNGKKAVYAVQSGDTLSSIATALAAVINAFETSYAVGDVVYIPGAYSLLASVGGVGTSIKEVGRLRRQLQVTYWCPTPALRDTISGPVVAALMALERMTLADQTSARIITVSDKFSDDNQKPLIYRRDSIYSVEYATTITEQDTQIIVTDTVMTGGIDPDVPAIATFSN